MSLSFESTSEQPQFLKIAYKISLRSEYMTLRVAGPSEHFFEFFNLETIPSISKQLPNFQVCKDSLNKISFRSRVDIMETDYGPLQKSLISFLQSFKVCIMCYAPQKKTQVEAIIKSLIQISSQLKIKKKLSRSERGDFQVIIYFPYELRDRVEQIIRHFKRFQKEILLFSLNFFIKDEIKSYLRAKFIEAIAEKYTKQIKEIPLKHSNFLNDVRILSIIPITIGPEHRSQEWSKQERQGIFGLQMQVEGIDYKILKLYSFLQNFFKKINYCVTNREKDESKSSREKYFQQKQNKMINFLLLSQQQVIIIGPPQEFQKTKTQLMKSFHTIDEHLYSYLDFSLLKKKENTFRRFLKVRHIDFQDMVISESTLTFYTDKANFEKIKYQTKQFLIDYIQEQFQLDFIQTERDFDIFYQFTFLPVQLSFQDVSLSWHQESATYKCPMSMVQNIYDRIKELYESHCSTLVERTGLNVIDDPLIKVILNPDDLNPEKYLKWMITAVQINFTIKIIDFYSPKKQDSAILLVKDINRCPQLLDLLDQTRIQTLRQKKDKFQQFILQSSQTLKSLTYWKLFHNSYESTDNRRQRLFFELMGLVQNDTKITFLITNQFFTSSFLGDFKSLLYKLVQSQYPVCKKITFILSHRLSTEQKVKFCFNTISFMKNELEERIDVQSAIPFESIREIISLKYFQLEWKYQHPNKHTQIFQASYLNSFVFFFERKNLQFKGNKFGIVLPKVDSVQIFVHLLSSKAYIVECKTLSKIHDHPLIDRISEMISVINQAFPWQTYIVLYSNKQKTKLISTVYVFDKESPRKLMKYVADNTDNKLKPLGVQPVEYKHCYQDIDRYRYVTHAQYKQEMEKYLLE